MIKKPRKLFFSLILLTLIAVFLDLPSEVPIKFGLGPIRIETTIRRPTLNLGFGSLRFKRDLEIRQGLDLRGGTHLVFEAEMSGIEEKDRDDALSSVEEIISRRIDLYGVAEPLIQTAKNKDQYRIIVELAGVRNSKEAIDLIGKTAQLDFREEPGPVKDKNATEAAVEEVSIFKYIQTGLTGKDLARAQVQFDQTQTGKPVVALLFTSEGKDKFASITTRNVGKPLAIFLDQEPITAPTVQQAITSGNAVITGDFTLEEAKNLAIQLNAGALPVPIKVIEQRSVGATLGQDSVVRSLEAGTIGLSMVVFFMAASYGWLGVIADAALLVYGLLTLVIYKLIPITVSLPGLTGFILSVGMAVDANILIFERMKEEERSGKPWRAAMELGFGRAWDSIKDANVATLLTCFVLLNPFEWQLLPTSGLARGFALTLGIGVLTSLFTGIVVTRTFLRVLYEKGENKSQSQPSTVERKTPFIGRLLAKARGKQ